MKIAEIYRSVQGEGLLTGADSVFVRASGCNLRCWYCDTPYASWQPEGRDLTVDEILAACEEWDAEHVVLTGGEPMLFAEMIPLTRDLAVAGRHITIETAGTLYLPVTCHLMSISPKLSNSTPTAASGAHWRRRHERTRHAPEIVARLMREYAHQLKFVVASPNDGAEVLGYLETLARHATIDRRRVLLMPQGTDAETLARAAAWLPEYCREHGFGYCPRMHIEWFGLARGT
jgi:7-carboxy-7-deazaguanine synthase